MSDHRQHRRTLYWLVGILLAVAAAMTFVKVRYFGFSLSGDTSFYYQADASVSFDPEKGKDAHITISLPEFSSGSYFIPDPAGGDRFKTEKSGGRLVAGFSSPADGSGARRTVSYRFSIIPAGVKGEEFPPPPDGSLPNASDDVKKACSTLLDRLDPKGDAPPEKLIPEILKALGAMTPNEKRAFSPHAGASATLEAAVSVLARRGIPARLIRGVYLDQKGRQQQVSNMLDAYYGGSWHAFASNTGTEGMPADFAVLQRGGSPLFEVSQASNSSIKFSVTKIPAGAAKLNLIRAAAIGDAEFSGFSMFSLPPSEQNMFKRLALLPLAILLIVLARNVVGIQTMGTFMPVLIAMSFLEMKLVPGLASFVIILAAGLGIRAWLTRLNLLMVPRISAVVVVVILLMQAITLGANMLKLPDFMGVTFFPLIIIAWTIERASTTWEEDGAANALKQLAASLVTAVVCYALLCNAYLQYLLYTFSELNLAILAVVLLLGTYTGYRLTELVRFSPLAKK